MDIRTKLILALVAVSLVSMFTFGAFIRPRAQADLRAKMLEALDELAESKRETLEWILVGWRERTDLVSSRTQLRASLDAYNRTDAATEVARLEQILADALEASTSATLFRLYGSDGTQVAAAARDGETPLPSRALSISTVPDETVYVGVELVALGVPQVSFATPVVVDGRTVGTLLAVYEALEIAELTGHSHDLGDTGELMIIAEDAAGTPHTLHPPRHGSGDGAGIVLSRGPGTLSARALSEGMEPAWEGVSDYRGQAVWAATRFLPETGWGLVVKVDEIEQVAQYQAFNDWLQSTALALSAFAILAGFVLGLRIAIPIHDLAEVANRIRGGEMDARAKVVHEDEVGVLAHTFNEMASEIEAQMSLLREFRKFFDVSVDMMCIAGTDGFFKRTNPAFTRVLGWTQEELTSRPFFDLVHPADLAATEREVAKLAEGIPTISFENRFMCHDGAYKRLRWATYPEDGVLYAIAHVMDTRPTD